MGHLARVKKFAAGIGIVTALTAMTITPALAADLDDSQVSASVVAGTRNVEIADFAFDSTAYSFTSRPIVKNDIQLKVKDETGTKTGWQVTMYATDLSNGAGSSIAASDFVVTAVDTIARVSGDVDGLPIAGSGVGTGSLAEATGGQVVLGAIEGTGNGEYTANVDFSLQVPGSLSIGTYTGTLTTTFGTAPAV